MSRRSEYRSIPEFLHDLAYNYEDIIRTIKYQYPPGNMHEFELSRHLKTIRVLEHKLRYIKPEGITISKEPLTSLSTKVQMLAAGENMGSAVNWWLLPKSSHPFSGSFRVVWSCVSVVSSC
jgi:hypothetical protein